MDHFIKRDWSKPTYSLAARHGKRRYMMVLAS